MDDLTLRYNMRKKFSSYQGDLRSQARLAYIGDPNGNVDVPGRPGYIYVCLNDAPPIPVFNKRVQAIVGMPVLIGYDPYEPWLLQVLSISTPNSDVITLGTLPAAMHVGPHADSHQMNGSDPVSLTKRNLTDGLVAPGDYSSGSAMVDVWGDVVFAGGAWREITDTTLDLSSHIPSSGSSRFVLVAVDTSGSIITIDGAIADGLVPDLLTIPNLPYGYVGLGAVRLYGGMPYVSENDQYTDIVDTRGSGWELRNFTSVGSATPQPIGLTSLSGNSGSASREDHIHAHGNLVGGSLHAVVTSGSPGFAPTLNGNASYYLDGTGNWSVPVGSGSGGMSGSAAPTPLSDAIPQSLGTAAAGTSGSASRGDHVHDHGDLLGGSLHALATSGSPGFLPTLSNNAATFLDGTGAFSVPPTSGSASIGSSSFWTNKGDIAVAVTTGSAIPHGIGTDAQVLSVDLSQPDGVKWVDSGAISFINNEDHSSECNGVDTDFFVVEFYHPNTTHVYLNGLRQRLGVQYNENADGYTVAFVTAPLTGDELVIDYQYQVFILGQATARWFAQLTSYNDGDPVPTWNSIYNSYSFAQASGSAQPIFRLNAWNGYSYVEFSAGSGQFLEMNQTVTNGRNCSYYLVVRLRDAVSVTNTFFKEGEYGTGNLLGTNSGGYITGLFDFVRWIGTSYHLNNGDSIALCVTVDFTGQTFSLYYGNTSFTSPGTANILATNKFFMGGIVGGSGPESFADVDIPEFLVFDKIHSASDRNFVLNFLRGRYNTTY